MTVARVSPVACSSNMMAFVLDSLILVLNDDCFKLPSTRAAEALASARELVTWCGDPANREKFSKWLVNTLKGSFVVSSRASRLRIEKMWEQY